MATPKVLDPKNFTSKRGYASISTPEGMRILASDEFLPTIRRFKYEFKTIVGNNLRQLIKSAQAMAINEAREHLRQLVYTAPLPDSAYNTEWGWTPDKYLALRRLGKVFEALFASPVTVGLVTSGYVSVRKDGDFFPSYYYAWVLNFGSENVGRNRAGHYTARPFWTLMVRLMQSAYPGLGRDVALAGIKRDAFARTLVLTSSSDVAEAL